MWLRHIATQSQITPGRRLGARWCDKKSILMRYVGASVSGWIAAPIAALWELVSDATRHPSIAGSGEVRTVTVRGGAMGSGAIFDSQQKIRGVPYVIANRVMIWEPPHTIAWRTGVGPFPGSLHGWWFHLRPELGGTRVENGVALILALPDLPPFALIGRAIAQGYAGSIHPTLRNLAYLVDAPPPTDVIEQLEPPAALAALLPPPIVSGAILAGGALLGLKVALRALRGRRA